MTASPTEPGATEARGRPIRVLVVDDQPVVRSGLTAFLMAHDDLELVGEAEDGEAALHACRRLRPDVVIMDMKMPGMDGAEATRAIREDQPEVQIIALTSFKEDDLVQRALDAGAIGFLLKNVSSRHLVEAIRDAHRGQPTLAPEATRSLIQRATRETPRLGEDLTDREREVLEWMVRGANNGQIADQLVVSRSTVKFHVSNILSKLAASSRTEAVAIALQHDLVD